MTLEPTPKKRRRGAAKLPEVSAVEVKEVAAYITGLFETLSDKERELYLEQWQSDAKVRTASYQEFQQLEARLQQAGLQIVAVDPEKLRQMIEYITVIPARTAYRLDNHPAFGDSVSN